MKRIQIYDPPMCCSTGVCGPQVDPGLASFAGFLNHVKQRGCSVERFNLAQQPIPFLENDAVKALLEREGVEALPIIVADGQLLLKGRYPDEAERAIWLNSIASIS